jgi:hypothetical protein
MPNKANEKAVDFDAFFTDEFGMKNTDTNMNNSARYGLHRNKFTNLEFSKDEDKSPTVRIPCTGMLYSANRYEIKKEGKEGFWTESSASGVESIKNMADPANNIILKALLDAKKGVEQRVVVKGLSYDFSYYFSEPIIRYCESLRYNKANWDQNKPINITLFFGRGTELNRSGIRSFFQENNDFAAIIVVPGIEKEDYNSNRWGISLTDIEIAGLLEKFFSRKVPYRVVILSAYSTGINGLNQTILNRLINLTHVQRVIIFDCLLEFASGSTVNSLKKISSTNSNIRIIIYWSTPGSSDANKLIDNDSKLKVVEDLKPIGLSMNSNVIPLAHKRKPYRALICARILQAGIKENLVEFSANSKTAFEALVLPPRGEMISDKTMYKSVYGSLPPTKKILDDWYNSNKKKVDAFSAFLDPMDGGVKSLISQIRDKLMGWPAKEGSELHDLLIPEFGWEYLPYIK